MPEPDSAKKFEYRGDLRETALPEMLYTIYMHRVPGVIEARQGSVLKKIFVRDGAVIHAASSDRADSLGSFLRQEGKLSEAQFTESMKERETSDRRYGEVLIERDILTPAQLYGAIQHQIRSIIWSLFSWHEGQVTFSIGAFEESDIIRIHLPLRQVILEGIKRAPDAKALLNRLGSRDTVLEPCYRAEELIEVGLDEAEYGFLSQVDGKSTLYDLCSSGPQSPGDNAKLLYAFSVLHLVKAPGVRGDSGGPVKVRLKTSGDSV